MTVFVKQPHCANRVICEAIKINLYQNFRKKGGYHLSPAWKTIIHILERKEKKPNIVPQICSTYRFYFIIWYIPPTSLDLIQPFLVHS